jgi:hypothetical protein
VEAQATISRLEDVAKGMDFDADMAELEKQTAALRRVENSASAITGELAGVDKV